MNRKTFTSIKSVIITLIVLVAGLQANAATFTAIASGNWSSTATWSGGNAPGNTIGSGDFVVIPFGISVNLDNSVEFNNTLSTFSVSGSVTSSNNSNLTINSGTLSGNGSIGTNNFTIGTTAVILFSGDINSNNFTNNNSLLNLSSDINVSGTVFINDGTLQLNGGSSLTLGNNGNININDGSLNLNGGLFTNVGLYNVTYTGGSSSFGLFLATNSLNNLTVSLDDNDDQLDLNGDLNIGGTLTISSGQLDISGDDLTINGSIISSGNGSIFANGSSNIIINSTGNPGSISFGTGGNIVGNFTLNSQGNSGLTLGSDLTINGMLDLEDGDFNIGGNSTLTLVGGFDNNNGSGGSIGIGSSSSIVLNGSGDWNGLSFNGGSINNFTINLSGNGTTDLDSDLIVNGNLNINSGTLITDGNDLTIGGTLTGSGFIYSDSGSSFIFNGSGNSFINFSGNGQTVNGFNVNIGGNGSLTLGSNLIIGGQYNQQNGSFIIGGFDLTLNGTNGYTGGGLMGSLTSSIFVGGSGNVGSIGFGSNGDLLEDLTVDIDGDGWISLASDLDITGDLNLTDGMVNTNDNDLTVIIGGQIVGGGSDSYVINTNGGHLMLNLGTGVTSTFFVGTTTNYSPIVISNNSTGSGYFGVGSHLGVFANGTSGSDMTTINSMVNTGWDIMSDISSGLNVNIQAFFSSDMYVNGFNSTSASLAHYTSGQWDLNTFGPVTAEGSGMFSITGTGYTSLSPFAVFDSNTITSVPENAATKPVISVYPNPTTDVVSVSVTDPNKYKRVRLFNMLGAEMTSIPVTSTITSVDMTGMPAGVYFVSIDKVTTQRIIKR